MGVGTILLQLGEAAVVVELGAEGCVGRGSLFLQLLNAKKRLLDTLFKLFDALCLGGFLAAERVNGLGGIGIGALQLGNLGILLFAETSVVGRAGLELALQPLVVGAQLFDLLAQVVLAEGYILGACFELLLLVLQLRDLLAQGDQLLVLGGQFLGQAVVCGRLGFVQGNGVAILAFQRANTGL